VKLLGFDIEIAKEVQGSDWDSQRPFGIAVAVALLRVQEGQQDAHVFYGGPGGKADPWPRMPRQQVCHLVIWLQDMVKAGFTICTWNGTRFDFSVLAEESGMEMECHRLALSHSHVDPMLQFVQEHGFGVGLGSLSVGEKSEGMSGAEAPRAWARGEYQRVIDYCTQDCALTLDAVITLLASGSIGWESKYPPYDRTWEPVGGLRSVPLVLREDHWAGSGIWSREGFTAWARRREHA
jgi:hypothetical protein